MFCFFSFRNFAIIAVLTLSTSLLAKQPTLAFVYNGRGVCEENCARAAGKVAKNLGLNVKYVTADDIETNNLAKADVWIQPGGEALEVVKALGHDKLEIIQQYVRNGGKYLGFCAGAFLADHTVDDAKTVIGLGFIPGESRDYSMEKNKSHMIPLLWHGATRYLYFEDGPTFDLITDSKTNVVATYPDGSPATIQFNWEKGRVALSGTHPEAYKNWKTSTHEEDPDGDDVDLAEGMLSWLLKGR